MYAWYWNKIFINIYFVGSKNGVFACAILPSCFLSSCHWKCVFFPFSRAGSAFYCSQMKCRAFWAVQLFCCQPLGVEKQRLKCAKVQFYFLFISCFLIGKWEQLCPGNKSRLFAYCVVIGLCIDGLAKSRCISVLIGYAN